MDLWIYFIKDFINYYFCMALIYILKLQFISICRFYNKSELKRWINQFIESVSQNLSDFCAFSYPFSISSPSYPFFPFFPSSPLSKSVCSSFYCFLICRFLQNEIFSFFIFEVNWIWMRIFCASSPSFSCPSCGSLICYPCVLEINLTKPFALLFIIFSFDRMPPPFLSSIAYNLHNPVYRTCFRSCNLALR